jgi:hypothetical protein
MKKQIWLTIWFLLLIAAGIVLYPYAYKSFAKPSLTVYVIDPANFKPITTGEVYLNYSSELVRHGLGMAYSLPLDEHGKATFNKIPPKPLRVFYFQLKGGIVSVDGISIGKHDGNVKMYLYYNDQNKGQANIIDKTNTAPAPSDTTMNENEPPSAPTREEAEAINENHNPTYLQRYVVLFDDVRLRDKPSLDGKTLTTLKTSDQVVYAGEQSKNTSLITLNGVVQVAHWVKVKTQTGLVGWIITNAIEEVNNDESWD